MYEQKTVTQKLEGYSRGVKTLLNEDEWVSGGVRLCILELVDGRFQFQAWAS